MFYSGVSNKTLIKTGKDVVQWILEKHQSYILKIDVPITNVNFALRLSLFLKRSLKYANNGMDNQLYACNPGISNTRSSAKHNEQHFNELREAIDAYITDPNVNGFLLLLVISEIPLSLIQTELDPFDFSMFIVAATAIELVDNEYCRNTLPTSSLMNTLQKCDGRRSMQNKASLYRNTPYNTSSVLKRLQKAVYILWFWVSPEKSTHISENIRDNNKHNTLLNSVYLFLVYSVLTGITYIYDTDENYKEEHYNQDDKFLKSTDLKNYTLSSTLSHSWNYKNRIPSVYCWDNDLAFWDTSIAQLLLDWEQQHSCYKSDNDINMYASAGLVSSSRNHCYLRLEFHLESWKRRIKSHYQEFKKKDKNSVACHCGALGTSERSLYSGYTKDADDYWICLFNCQSVLQACRFYIKLFSSSPSSSFCTIPSSIPEIIDKWKYLLTYTSSNNEKLVNLVTLNEKKKFLSQPRLKIIMPFTTYDILRQCITIVGSLEEVFSLDELVVGFENNTISQRYIERPLLHIRVIQVYSTDPFTIAHEDEKDYTNNMRTIAFPGNPKQTAWRLSRCIPRCLVRTSIFTLEEHLNNFENLRCVIIWLSISYKNQTQGSKPVGICLKLPREKLSMHVRSLTLIDFPLNTVQTWSSQNEAVVLLESFKLRNLTTSHAKANCFCCGSLYASRSHFLLKLSEIHNIKLCNTCFRALAERLSYIPGSKTSINRIHNLLHYYPTCRICGSSDGERLALCFTPGCRAAYHSRCLWALHRYSPQTFSFNLLNYVPTWVTASCEQLRLDCPYPFEHLFADTIEKSCNIDCKLIKVGCIVRLKCQHYNHKNPILVLARIKHIISPTSLLQNGKNNLCSFSSMQDKQTSFWIEELYIPFTCLPFPTPSMKDYHQFEHFFLRGGVCAYLPLDFFHSTPYDWEHLQAPFPLEVIHVYIPPTIVTLNDITSQYPLVFVKHISESGRFDALDIGKSILKSLRYNDPENILRCGMSIPWSLFCTNNHEFITCYPNTINKEYSISDNDEYEVIVNEKSSRSRSTSRSSDDHGQYSETEKVLSETTSCSICIEMDSGDDAEPNNTNTNLDSSYLNTKKKEEEKKCILLPTYKYENTLDHIYYHQYDLSLKNNPFTYRRDRLFDMSNDSTNLLYIKDLTSQHLWKQPFLNKLLKRLFPLNPNFFYSDLNKTTTPSTFNYAEVSPVDDYVKNESQIQYKHIPVFICRHHLPSKAGIRLIREKRITPFQKSFLLSFSLSHSPPLHVCIPNNQLLTPLSIFPLPTHLIDSHKNRNTCLENLLHSNKNIFTQNDSNPIISFSSQLNHQILRREDSKPLFMPLNPQLNKILTQPNLLSQRHQSLSSLPHYLLSSLSSLSSLDSFGILELFSSAGLGTIGALKQNFRLLDAVDNDKNMITLFKLLYGELPSTLKRLVGDNYTLYPPFAILGTGPPCQGFSRVAPARSFKARVTKRKNYKRAVKHRKGILELILTALIFQPPMVLIENVCGLKDPVVNVYLGSAIQLLLSSGYSLHCVKLCCQQVGLPQTRERIFIIAARNDITSFSELPEDWANRYYHPENVSVLSDFIGDLSTCSPVDIGTHMHLSPNTIHLLSPLGQSLRMHSHRDKYNKDILTLHHCPHMWSQQIKKPENNDTNHDELIVVQIDADDKEFCNYNTLSNNNTVEDLNKKSDYKNENLIVVVSSHSSSSSSLSCTSSHESNYVDTRKNDGTTRRYRCRPRYSRSTGNLLYEYEPIPTFTCNIFDRVSLPYLRQCYNRDHKCASLTCREMLRLSGVSDSLPADVELNRSQMRALERCIGQGIPPPLASLVFLYCRVILEEWIKQKF